ncbi:MAG: hypothetical protein O3C10_08455 [Chloroflexi bacterium]|nr:hypothetical protein [Chloroflexota bacterium]
MLKAIVSYSKKVPVEGQQYSSQCYSLSLETEVPETDPASIQAKLHSTFELVKSTVEQELANGNGNGHGAHPPDTDSQPARRTNGSDQKASNKQIKFITDLAGRQGIAISDLNARVRKDYGVGSLYDLDKKQASRLLDDLNGKRQAA